MPYITSHRIEELMVTTDDMTSGDLNYLITKRILRLIDEVGETYGIYSKIVGFLEVIKLNQYNLKNTPRSSVELSFFDTFSSDVINIVENNNLSVLERIGTLVCVQHELYRRMISVYEDKKKEMNGDVFAGTI
jgi:hypothetical protein